MKATLNRLVHLKLQEVNPEIYEQCIRISTPPVQDLTLLPDIMSHLVERNERTPENTCFMISVAYYLIAPHKLYSLSIKLAPGIRTVMADKLGYVNGELINHYSKFIMPMWKNARYRQRVEQEAEMILQLIGCGLLND